MFRGSFSAGGCFSTRSIESCEESSIKRCGVAFRQCFSTRSIESCEECNLRDEIRKLTPVSVLALSSRVRNHSQVLLVDFDSQFQYSLYRVV